MAFIAYHRPRLLGQSGNLLIEEFLSLLPDARILAVLELQQAWHQSFAEHLGALTGKKRREVINADHAERRTLAATWQSHRYCGLIEGGGDVVDRDWVVGVSAMDGFSSLSWVLDGSFLRISANVADNRQATLGGIKALNVDNWSRVSNHSTKQLPPLSIRQDIKLKRFHLQ